jgi:hypothetical protein
MPVMRMRMMDEVPLLCNRVCSRGATGCAL